MATDYLEIIKAKWPDKKVIAYGGSYETIQWNTLDTTANPTKAELDAAIAAYDDSLIFYKACVFQRLRGTLSQMSGNTKIPFDTTTPQATEGSLLFTQAITPKSSDSTIKLTLSCLIDASGSNTPVILTVFRNGVFIGFACASPSGGSGSSPVPIAFFITDKVVDLNPITYSVRIGTTSGTWYLGRGANETMGGSNKSHWELVEEL